MKKVNLKKKKTIGHALDLIGKFLFDKDVVKQYQKTKKFKDAQKALEYLQHLSGEKLKCLTICNTSPSDVPYN